jgi:hypothetical protein
MKVMVQELLTEDQIALGVPTPEEIVYKELASEYLTGRQVILCMQEVIDQEGYQILDMMDAEGRGTTTYKAEHDTYSQKIRTEKSAIISNGRNTIQLLDWVERDVVVRHDPIIRVIGPDAMGLADFFCGKLLDVLAGHLVTVEFNSDVAKDIASLVGLTEDEMNTVQTDAESMIKELVKSVTG